MCVDFGHEGFKAYIGSLGVYEYTEDLRVDYLKNRFNCSSERTLMRDQKIYHARSPPDNENYIITSNVVPIGDLQFDSITLFVDTWAEETPDFPSFDMNIHIYMVPTPPKQYDSIALSGTMTLSMGNEKIVGGCTYKEHGFYAGTIKHTGSYNIGQAPEAYGRSEHRGSTTVWKNGARKSYKLPTGDYASGSTSASTGNPYARYMFVAVTSNYGPSDCEVPFFCSITLQGQKPPRG
jgi:hypothetical protein